MTFTSIATLFGVMVIGAMVPSFRVFAVLARSAAFGFVHGVFTSLGIVVGDIIFILTAIYGLSVLADLMGNHFIWIKYLGGAYLIWLGTGLLRSETKANGVEINSAHSLLSSFMTGLLITLSDQKAILFYLGFFPAFPAFVDISKMSFSDTGIIVGVAIVAVGGAKLFYAFMADKASLIFKSAAVKKFINTAAGSVMIAVGVFVMVKA